MRLYAIYFEPEDWVAFREVRRFGPSDRVESVSLPSPFPFYGAVRTALLKKWGIKLELGRFPDIDEKKREIIGGPDNPGKIKMFGPFIFKRTQKGIEHYFPAPRNIYRFDGKYKTMPMLNESEDEFKLPWIGEFSGAVKVEAQYIEASEIKKLKSGQEFQPSDPDCYEVELRLGIGLSKDSKLAEERMIYTMSVYRFRNGGFFMLCDEETCRLVSQLDGVFLGAKQRWAKVWIEEFKETDIFQPPNGNAAVWLLTPAIFDDGMIPKSKQLQGAKILGIVGAKKTVISGWDVANNRSKPIHHAAGVGTVYYLDRPIDGFVLRESKFNEFGFGTVAFMKWDYFEGEE